MDVLLSLKKLHHELIFSHNHLPFHLQPSIYLDKNGDRLPFSSINLLPLNLIF